MSKISDLVIRDQLSKAHDVYKPIESTSEPNAYPDCELAVKTINKLVANHAAMIDRLVDEGKDEQERTRGSDAPRQKLASELFEALEVTDDR